MKSFLTTWYLNLKLDVTFEESLRLRPKVLDFRSHGLEKCPNLLEKLPLVYLNNLKCLALQSNLLVNFSRVNCHCLEKLKGLALDYNKLVDLPFDIRHLQNLTSINVSHNKFKNLHFFHIVCKLTNLRILWANATGLTEIPVAEIMKLTKLHTLGLRRNRITVLPVELMGLSSLKWLTLDDNLIGEIPSDLCQITSSLVHLNLRRNYISEIPDSFRLLRELQYLFLDYNLLPVDDNLKAFLRTFPSLKYCSLSGNLPISRHRTGTGGIITDDDLVASYNDTGTENNDLPNAFSLASFAQSIRRESNEGNFINEPILGIRLTENTIGEGNDTDTSMDTTGDEAEISNDNGSGEWGDIQIVYHQSQDVNHQENDYVENEYDSTGDGSLQGEETFTGQVNTGELLSYLSDDDDDVDDADQSPQSDLAFDDPTTAYSENDMQIPFESSSAISLLEMETLTTEAIIHPIASYEARENRNLNSSVPSTSYSSGHRMNWTEEWVQHLDKVPGENTVSPMNDKQDEEREQNDESLQHVVNDIINEAANDNTPTIVVDEPPVSRSTSKVYIMPHGKESQPLCLNARSSFSTCNNNNFSNSIVTPLEHQGESFGTVTSHTHLGNVSSRTSHVHQSQHESHENIEINNSEALDLAINQDDLENQAEENEAESDYDPSDWEHSAPSSAIDDQDIISRYAEFEEEGLGDDENFMMDILRILPLAFVR